MRREELNRLCIGSNMNKNFQKMVIDKSKIKFDLSDHFLIIYFKFEQRNRSGKRGKFFSNIYTLMFKIMNLKKSMLKH